MKYKLYEIFGGISIILLIGSFIFSILTGFQSFGNMWDNICIIIILSAFFGSFISCICCVISYGIEERLSHNMNNTKNGSK